jgi:hypothetical protein
MAEQDGSGEGADRQTGAETEITPQAIEEFRSLFSEWRDSYPTFEQLEVGGLGDLESLLRLILPWARTLMRKRPTIS